MDSYARLKDFYTVSQMYLYSIFENSRRCRRLSWPPLMCSLVCELSIQKHRHCNVSKKENPSLYKWVARQRGERNQFLTADRRALLDDIGFEWSSTRDAGCEAQWETNFSMLKAYRKRGGTFKLSAIQEYNKTLSVWVSNQRKRNNRGMLRGDRKERLVSIGFEFGEPRKRRTQIVGEAYEQKWEQMYHRLLEFKKKHGHTSVPYSYTEDRGLALWVTTQRREYHQKSWYGVDREMRENRRKQLDEIGFVWDNSGKKDRQSLESPRPIE